VAAVFVYSDGYYADLGGHVFPIEKYRRVREELEARKVFEHHVLMEPHPASREDLLLVHDREYVDDLLQARLTSGTVASEMPLGPEIVQAFLLAAGGTILACLEALEKGCAVNLGGGFHHAFPDHAEGFCYVNDMAVGVRRLQRERGRFKTAIIDCDLHQGNGTAFIFRDDENVFTFSIHQRDLYPEKEDSNWDIHLRKEVGDGEYLTHLQGAVPAILDKFQPDLVLYQAGADPYEGDQLGDLRLTLEGLKRRDDLVFRECRKRAIPVATVLGGGYALDPTDTVAIHVNTCLAAVEYAT
jgi:acetoin utilization deacetylase AcuC-like enzyme